MKYFRWQYTLVLFSLVSNFVLSANKLEVGYNYDESKNVSGYSKNISEYDFDNDGEKEKAMIFLSWQRSIIHLISGLPVLNGHQHIHKLVFEHR